jgi:hypothetical protein
VKVNSDSSVKVNSDSSVKVNSDSSVKVNSDSSVKVNFNNCMNELSILALKKSRLNLRRNAVFENIVCVLNAFTMQDVGMNKILTKDLTLFHNSKIPNLSIRSYFARIMTYSCASLEVFIQVLYHLVQLKADNKIEISAFTIHRLLLTATLVTAKFHDDEYYNNKYYAKIGGITLKELNILEIEYLHLTEYFLMIDSIEYEVFCEELNAGYNHVDCKHGKLFIE